MHLVTAGEFADAIMSTFFPLKLHIHDFFIANDWLEPRGMSFFLLLKWDMPEND